METLAGLPRIPSELEYLWGFYKELNQTRQHNGWAYNNITYAEIAAWCSLCNVKLDPWELDAILRLDGIFLTVMANVKKGS